MEDKTDYDFDYEAEQDPKSWRAILNRLDLFFAFVGPILAFILLLKWS